MNPLQRESNPTRLGIPGRAMILAVLVSAAGTAGIFTEVLRSGRSTVEQSLISRINPNTADASLLMTLPNIGPARASAIVKYRQQRGSDVMVFRRVEDLQAVKGIGPKISENLQPWMDFENAIAEAEE